LSPLQESFSFFVCSNTARAGCHVNFNDRPSAVARRAASLQGDARGPAELEPCLRADLIRHDWTRQEIQDLFEKPFADLLFEAQTVHRRFHDPNRVQLSTLISIKTGGCPED